MTRFKPVDTVLDSKLKPFIPAYIPAIGEVDAFLKVSRPDNIPEELGLTVLVFFLLKK
jgi:intraflagellar transport protein 46